MRSQYRPGGVVVVDGVRWALLDRAWPSGWWATPCGDARGVSFRRLLVSRDVWRFAPELGVGAK